MRRHNSRRGSSTGKIAGVIFLAILLGWAGNDTSSTSTTVDTCTDGIDNDGDGNIDQNDPECNTTPGNPDYDGTEDNPLV